MASSSSKKIVPTTAKDSDFQVLELFPVSAFNPGRWVNPKIFANSSVEYVEIMKKTGWNDALCFHRAWYHDPTPSSGATRRLLVAPLLVTEKTTRSSSPRTLLGRFSG